MPELLYAMLSTIVSPNEWEFLQYFVPFCVIFAVFFICRILLGDFGDITAIHPLLLCCCLSLPMWTTGAKKPARCTEKLQKPKKEGFLYVPAKSSICESSYAEVSINSTESQASIDSVELQASVDSAESQEYSNSPESEISNCCSEVALTISCTTKETDCCFSRSVSVGATSSANSNNRQDPQSDLEAKTSKLRKRKTKTQRKRIKKLNAKTEIPVVLEPAKKKPLKEKRKRKKSADKDNKDPIKMDTYRNSVQTTIYSTLPLYEDVKNGHSLEDSDLYVEFNRYILTPEQLAKNDFPLECPENPGQIISRCKKFRQDPTSRTCSRCHQTFHIEKDEYISETNCLYHTARCDVGHFKCCDTSYGSKGCQLSLYHVSSELALDNLIFKRVEGKRQVREDQSRKVYALDCEMVFTTIGMEVTKVGLVDLEGKTIYQTFVLPEHPVLDYNTKFSGITANDLKGITITLADVQSFLLRTLNKDTILVGHALQNDLRVLRLIHEKVVDTQVVFHEGNYRRKLKALAHEYLEKSIQDSKAGHDSIEDARACMELMLWKIKSDLDKRPPLRKKQSFPASCLKNVRPILNKKIQQPKDVLPSEIQPMGFPLRLTLDYSVERKKPKDLSKIQPMPIPVSLRLDYKIDQNNFCRKCGSEKSALGQTLKGGMTFVCPWCFYNIVS